jgi:hypothetical protein
MLGVQDAAMFVRFDSLPQLGIDLRVQAEWQCLFAARP